MYETFSILSGVTLVVCAVLPTTSPRDRLLCLAGGAFFIGYGIYVAQATSGYFVFPAIIFVLPFVGVFLVAQSFLRSFASSSTSGAAHPAVFASDTGRPIATTVGQRIALARSALAAGAEWDALEHLETAFAQGVERDDASGLAAVEACASDVARVCEERRREARATAAVRLGRRAARAREALEAASVPPRAESQSCCECGCESVPDPSARFCGSCGHPTEAHSIGANVDAISEEVDGGASAVEAVELAQCWSCDRRVPRDALECPHCGVSQVPSWGQSERMRLRSEGTR